MIPPGGGILISIDASGAVQFIHSDDLAFLFEEGEAEIKRASHVEPCGLLNGKPAWTADLSPVDGPVLGPFATRAEALAEEVRWLNKNVL